MEGGNYLTYLFFFFFRSEGVLQLFLLSDIVSFFSNTQLPFEICSTTSKKSLPSATLFKPRDLQGLL